MDGGVQLRGLAPDATRPAGASDGTMEQLRQGRAQAPPPAGWASLLTARVKQAAGLGAHPPSAGRDTVGPAHAAPAADPLAVLAGALSLLREQLERERHRADAAEQGGLARIAAAEARVAVAERQLREVQAVLARREAALGTAQGRITTIEGHLAGATRRAEQAEGEAKAAKAELRRLRMRGLWARILDLD